MSVNYDPDGDVLIPDEMRERFEREALEYAAQNPPKSVWSDRLCRAVGLGLVAVVFAYLLLAILERSGN